MREIVIISGKGGAGKTTLAATLAMLLGRRAVVADCDVDAADMHLLLQPDETSSEAFYSGEEPHIEMDKCVGCGACARVCRFEALRIEDGKAALDAFNCEGCGYCARVCPAGAIDMRSRYTGELFTSTVRNGAKMIHARLEPGGENSGKLVARVKKDARLYVTDDVEFILVDGSPGIGCPVISSLSGADYVVFVTEPSRSALHDLERVMELIERFRLPSGCVLNKSDIHPQEARALDSLLEQKGVPLLGAIPYDERILEAVRRGVTPVVHAPEAFETMYREILDNIITHSKETT